MRKDATASGHSAACHRLTRLFPRIARQMRRYQDGTTPPTATELGPRHVATLEQLRDGPLVVGDLAARLGLNLSTASGLVADLDRAGLVQRSTDPADRRRTIVRIDDANRPTVTEWLDGAAAPLARVLDQLGDDERRAFLKAMDLLEVELGREQEPTVDG